MYTLSSRLGLLLGTIVSCYDRIDCCTYRLAFVADCSEFVVVGFLCFVFHVCHMNPASVWNLVVCVITSTSRVDEM